MKRATLRIELLSGIKKINHTNFQCRIQKNGLKVLIRMKRHPNLDSADVICWTRSGRLGRYGLTDAKTVAYNAHAKAKREASDQEFWYEQLIDLPFECDRQLCKLEPHAPKGYAIATDGIYNEIHFEFIQVHSSWDVSQLEASFDSMIVA